MRDMRVIMDTDKTGENLKQLRKNAGLRVQDVRESLGMESAYTIGRATENHPASRIFWH